MFIASDHLESQSSNVCHLLIQNEDQMASVVGFLQILTHFSNYKLEWEMQLLFKKVGRGQQLFKPREELSK